jgi:hypothetical protein
VIVEALDSAGGLQLARNLLDKLTEWPHLTANLTTAFGFAVASNLINNLPVGLIGASALHASGASVHLANAMLMGDRSWSKPVGDRILGNDSVAHRPATGEPSGERMEFFEGRRNCDAPSAFAGLSFPRVHFSTERALPGRTEAISYEPVPNIAERIPPINSESITEYRSCNQPMSRSLNMDRRFLVPASSDSICSLS